MNIFETLNHGKGCINEENISSFLAYLLDPNEDHGLGTVFLEKFLNKLNLSDGEIKTTDMNNLDITLEFPVDKRYIDIVFETSEHIIAIENKILEKSKQNGQLQDEYNGLKSSEAYKNSNKSILMVYLVPEKDRKEKFEPDKNSKDKYQLLLWEDVINSLITILDEENQCKINPINDYTKHTIKAFISFMNSTIQPKYFYCNEKYYRIFKYSSGRILVEQEEQNEWKEAVPSSKAIIREKLKELKLYCEDNNYTTRQLGSKLYKELK